MGNFWEPDTCGGTPNDAWPYISATGTVDWSAGLATNPFSGAKGPPLLSLVAESDADEEFIGVLPDAGNYPNPFNSGTIILFGMRQPGPVEVAVFNILGQRVRTLAAGDRDAGVHRIPWDGRDRSGKTLASGVYFLRIVTPERYETRKMVMLK